MTRTTALPQRLDGTAGWVRGAARSSIPTYQVGIDGGRLEFPTRIPPEGGSPVPSNLTGRTRMAGASGPQRPGMDGGDHRVRLGRAGSGCSTGRLARRPPPAASGVGELPIDRAKDEARGLRGLAAETLALVLLEREHQVVQHLVEQRGAHQDIGRER